MHVRIIYVRLKAYLCEQLPACARFVLRVFIELHMRKLTSEETPERGRHNKLSDCDKRRLIRCITVLRKRERNFTCKAIMDEAGIQQKDVSVRTVSWFLNSQNYYYLQTRKKGAHDSGRPHQKG